MKQLLLLLSALALIGFTSCTQAPKRELKIAFNPWIGFVPFYYMQEKGLLEDKNIKFVSVVSLFESVKLMESGAVDGMGGSQMELNHLLKTKNVKPYIFVDRSNGADAIFSNATLDELKQAKKPIEVYLEVGSVNELLLDLFTKEHNINVQNYKLINKDQFSISRMKLTQNPTLLVTYEPYLEDVRRNGYDMIADSNDDGLDIIDMLVIHNNVENEFHQELAYLRKEFFEAVKVAHNNPKLFYDVVKQHLDGQSYNDFILSVKGIEWLNPNQQSIMMDKVIEKQ